MGVFFLCSSAASIWVYFSPCEPWWLVFLVFFCEQLMLEHVKSRPDAECRCVLSFIAILWESIKGYNLVFLHQWTLNKANDRNMLHAFYVNCPCWWHVWHELPYFKKHNIPSNQRRVCSALSTPLFFFYKMHRRESQSYRLLQITTNIPAGTSSCEYLTTQWI